MTLHSEIDMARGLGAAIELYSRRDSVIETRKDWHLHMQFKSPLSLIQGFVLCLIAVLRLSQVGRRSSRLPRMQKSIVRFSKPELLSFDELVELE